MTVKEHPYLSGLLSGAGKNIVVLLNHEILIIKKLLHHLLTINPTSGPAVQIAPKQRHVLRMISERLARDPGANPELGREELKYKVLPLAAYLVTYSPRICSPQDKEFIRTHPALLYTLWYKTAPGTLPAAGNGAVPRPMDIAPAPSGFVPLPAGAPPRSGQTCTQPVNTVPLPAGRGPSPVHKPRLQAETFGSLPAACGSAGAAVETASAGTAGRAPGTKANAAGKARQTGPQASFFRAFAVLSLVIFFISYFMFAGVRINESTLSPERPARKIEDSTRPETAGFKIPNYTPLAGEIAAGLYLTEPGMDFQNKLTLTLDDIELNANIDSILRTLQKYNIEAVFFIETSMLVDSVGRPYPHSREFLQKILLHGHTLGNHSFGHPNFAMLKPASIAANLHKAEEIIDEILGFHYNIRYIRPPYGSRGKTRIVDKIVRQDNQLLILWQIDSSDWKMNLGYADSRHLSAQQVINRTLTRIKNGNGGVILLHGFQHINSVLEPIIRRTLAFKNKRGGYRFVPLEELLEIKYRGK